MTAALSRADVLILLYAGIAVIAAFCVYAAAEWAFWRLVDHHASTGEDLAEPDHAVCEHRDGCDVVLCYCGNPDLCPGTESGRCSHHLFLCSEHAHVDCWDCRYDAQVEREQAFAREHLGEWS